MANAEQRDEDQTPGINRLAREVADWEYVSQGLRSYTQRKQVPGGWLYRTVVEQHPAMCFVPAAAEPAAAMERPYVDASDQVQGIALTPKEEEEAEDRFVASLSMFTPEEQARILNAQLDFLLGKGPTFKESLEPKPLKERLE